MHDIPIPGSRSPSHFPLSLSVTLFLISMSSFNTQMGPATSAADRVEADSGTRVPLLPWIPRVFTPVDQEKAAEGDKMTTTSL